MTIISVIIMAPVLATILLVIMGCFWYFYVMNVVVREVHCWSKLRISAVEYSNGRQAYRIEKRILFVFWVCGQKTAESIVQHLEFDYLADAACFLTLFKDGCKKRRKKAQCKKVRRTRVIKHSGVLS
jgi:hypothetical protein